MSNSHKKNCNMIYNIRKYAVLSSSLINVLQAEIVNWV
jgi:hypothetical protein